VYKEVNDKWNEVRLEDVLYVPAKKNLFSIRACISKKLSVIFKQDRVILTRNGETVAEGAKQENNI